MEDRVDRPTVLKTPKIEDGNLLEYWVFEERDV